MKLASDFFAVGSSLSVPRRAALAVDEHMASINVPCSEGLRSEWDAGTNWQS